MGMAMDIINDKIYLDSHPISKGHRGDLYYFLSKMIIYICRLTFAK